MNKLSNLATAASISAAGTLLVGLALWGFPQYRVWHRDMAGQAALAEAKSTRRVRVEEAEAEKDAAGFLAEAEEIRAHGVANANKIIGDSLRNNEAYLRYLWVQGLHDGSSETIYIPTEANIPILEASRIANGACNNEAPGE